MTPGHVARWATDGVLSDGGAGPYYQQSLAQILQASFNTTVDQPLLLPPSLNAFWLTGIVVTNAPTSLTVAAGGFYPQAGKAGSPLVAAGQVYAGLTGVTLLMQPALTTYASTHRMSRLILPNWAIYLSLTTPQGIAATADVYVLGVPLA